MKHFKRYARRCMRYFMRRIFFPALYCLGCLRKIDPKLVLFVNDLVDFMPDNFIPLMKELTAQGFTCVHLGKRQGNRMAQYGQLARYYLLYARAHTVFLVEGLLFTSCIKPRRGTRIVQLWHGCGAFKQWGYSTLGTNWGDNIKAFKWFPTHRHYTFASVSAPEVIPHYAEAFGCKPELIHPWGAPRTDFFFASGMAEQCRKQVLEAMPEIGNRKLVLYAPTFRGNNMKKARHDDVLDYELMQQELGKHCALLFKPHPRARAPVPEPGKDKTPFVFDAADIPIHVLLCAADLVITDYSSLIFEYSLLERPMLFYAYDLAQYDKTRSFYYPYLDFVPGDLVWDTEDVIAGIKTNLLESRFDAKRVRKFREKFMSACDGNSTQRIIEKVFGE